MIARASIAIILFLVPLSVFGQGSGEAPSLSLELSPCLSVPQSEVRRVVSVELGARFVEAGSPDTTIVSARCSGEDFIIINVEDQLAGTCSRRRNDFSNVAEPARARTLALAIVEAVAASWIELESGGEPSPSCAERQRDGPEVNQPAKRSSHMSRGQMKLSRRAWALALGLGAASLYAVPQAEAEQGDPGGAQCVSLTVRKNVLQCPNIIKNASKRGGRGLAKGAKVVTKQPRKVAGTAQPNFTTPPPLPNSGFQKQRQRAVYKVLLQERELAAKLLANTSKRSQQYIPRSLRLADIHELLGEALQAKVRALDDPIHKTQNKTRKNRLVQKQQRLVQEEVRSYVEAIKLYRDVSQNAPHYTHRDEVLFREGFLLEKLSTGERIRREIAGQKTPTQREKLLRDKARQAFRDLIRQHPASRFVPHAYLSFGDYYFNESNMAAALRFYEQVIQHPNAHDYVAFARHKSAWCQINLQNDRQSMEQFVKVIEYAKNNPDSPNASHLARASKTEMIPPFSRAFRPGKAWQFFQRIGGTDGTTMMENLAQHYFDQGQWTEAIASYRSLMRENEQSENLCIYQVRVADASRRGRSKPQQMLEIRRTVDLMNTYLARQNSQASEQSCRQEVAQMFVDVATGWHQEAVGTDRSPGTDDAQTIEFASEIYGTVVQQFSDLDSLELEGWSQQDRPTLYRLAFWGAELLHRQRRWAECGPAFDRIVDMDTSPSAEFLEDSAYLAALCYDNLYRERYGDESELRQRREAEAQAPSAEELQPRELNEDERAIVRAFHRYVCFVTESQDLTRVKFRLAMIYYEANRFEEASLMFREISYDSPTDELASLAAQLYLDSLNAISRRDSARISDCNHDMLQAVGRFLGDNNFNEIDEELSELQCQLLWQRAESYSTEGQFDRCARGYLGIYRDHYDQCQQIGEHGLDDVLFNAAICLESDYRIGQAIEVRQRLIEEYGEDSDFARESGKASPRALRALYQIGGNYHAIAAYTKAADHYERFARHYPGEPEAPEALKNATVFRMGLGQQKLALRNSKLFEKNYGRRKAARTATVVGAVGELFLHNKRWVDAEKHYRGFLKRYGKRASVDELISGYVSLGYAQWKQGDRRRSEATKQFRKAVALADRGRQKQETTKQRVARYRKMLLGSENNLNPEGARKLARMINSIAKARFFIAEEQYHQFLAIRLPPFVPDKRLAPSVRRFQVESLGREKFRNWELALRYMPFEDRRLMLAQAQFDYWTAKRLTPWVQRREKAGATAAKAYDETVREDVPEWEIAAAARMGEMNLKTMQSFYDTPIPPLIRDDEELLARFEDIIDSKAEPYRIAAIKAYEHCLKVSTSNRWFNDWSRGCEYKLYKLNPRDYPMADEFRAEPNLFGNPLAIPGMVKTLELDPE